MTEGAVLGAAFDGERAPHTPRWGTALTDYAPEATAHLHAFQGRVAAVITICRAATSQCRTRLYVCICISRYN